MPVKVVKAIRFIRLTPPEKIFSFSLGDEGLRLLGIAAEKYILSRVQRRLSALEFYKGLMDENE